MTQLVTAAMLYNLVACPHRVSMDLYADPVERDEPNAFIELLWEKGSLYEREVMAALREPYCDLSFYSGDEKERLTSDAMQRREPLIYSGRMSADGLLGDPDLLRRQGNGYIAGDIKSGSGEEGPEDNLKAEDPLCGATRPVYGHPRKERAFCGPHRFRLGYSRQGGPL